MDLVQKRYGWSDEQIKRIPSMRFFEIVETIIEARRDEEKQRLKEIAYGQWCAYWFTPVNGKHKEFKAYCTAVGLGGKKASLRWAEKTTEEISAATERIRKRHGRSKRGLQDRSEDPDQCEDGDN